MMGDCGGAGKLVPDEVEVVVVVEVVVFSYPQMTPQFGQRSPTIEVDATEAPHFPQRFELVVTRDGATWVQHGATVVNTTEKQKDRTIRIRNIVWSPLLDRGGHLPPGWWLLEQRGQALRFTRRRSIRVLRESG
jgi:hypothetical protein